ncbi:MAG: hypothetical protein CMC15_16055 [Flavobacteriaceae bacterium]|jgi:hypothetical protein|nr:hypothetical protein [Flavobacteriaceae bacterium]|tara:strand:- start:762 stop:1079 length:318 start_codon:yes stop_codon:yes gene_type:complete
MKTKLGKNKGLERSRIWIEGTRLTDAGFHRGEYYLAEYEGDALILSLIDDETVIDFGAIQPRKVSGKGDHPIIDITGKAVKEFFDGSEYVEVDYEKGVIVIRGVK